MVRLLPGSDASILATSVRPPNIDTRMPLQGHASQRAAIGGLLAIHVRPGTDSGLDVRGRHSSTICALAPLGGLTGYRSGLRSPNHLVASLPRGSLTKNWRGRPDRNSYGMPNDNPTLKRPNSRPGALGKSP